jgi:branched-chain amino acid transport system substrate-binding protein
MASRRLPDEVMSVGSWLLAVSLWLSGCSASPTQPAPTSPATEVPPSAVPSPLPSVTPAPPPTPTPFVPKATIKIASNGPMSGDLAPAWTNLAQAVELAVAQTAPAFEAMGFKIELVSYDDQNDIGVAVGTAKEIVADPEILCGVGNYTSRIFRQTQAIYHRAGLAFISPSATNPIVTEFRYPEVNRVVGRDDWQGGVAAMFAEAQGLARAFVVSQTNDYARLNAYQFRTEAGRRGVEVVGNMKTDAMTDFQSVVDAAIATRADAVYFSTYSADQAGAFIREAWAAGYQGVFLGPDGLNNPSLLTAAGPFAIEGGGVFFTTTAAEPQYSPEAASFISDFEVRFGERPQMCSPQAYDAASICMKAIQEASMAAGGALPTRAEVAAAVRALEEYRGISGTFTFNESGEPDPARYFVFRVDSIDPEDWSQNTMVASFDLAPPE